MLPFLVVGQVVLRGVGLVANVACVHITCIWLSARWIVLTNVTVSSQTPDGKELCLAEGTHFPCHKVIASAVESVLDSLAKSCIAHLTHMLLLMKIQTKLASEILSTLVANGI